VGLLTNPALIAVANKSVSLIPASKNYLKSTDASNPLADWAFVPLTDMPTVRQRLNICTDDPTAFNDQPSAADCTGVAVGPDLILTAAHCILSNAEAVLPPGQKIEDFYQLRTDLDQILIVFDYKLDKSGALPNLSSQKVWKIAKVEKWDYIAGVLDYALLRVINISNDKSVKIASERIAECYQDMKHFDGYNGTTGVFTVGCPSGAPLKYTGPAQVISPTIPSLPVFFFINKGTVFGCMLNSTGGNSGGPVYFDEFPVNPDAKPKLLGIVVGSNPVTGQSDFVFDNAQQCQRINTIPKIITGSGAPKDPATGEKIQGKIVIRIEAIFPFIQTALLSPI